MPSGPGIIADDVARLIANATPPSVASFMLTSELNAAGIIAHWQRVRASTIQIVDYVREEIIAELRAVLPGVKLVQVIHVSQERDIKFAISLERIVDAFLLDSGNTGLPIKELGGTGRVHDWQLSAKLVQSTSKPVWLAGGLTPENVAEAIQIVRPFGLDVCSGIRVAGRLDLAKAEAFMQAVAGTNSLT
jgi:phosphoribosylanthranilate isomerase